MQKNKEIVPYFEPLQIAAGFYHSIILIKVMQKDKFIEDLRQLYKEAEITGDIQFMVQGQKIKAHKFILMTRCEVLNHMVAGPMLGGS